jgi:hypothetical protein
MTSPPWASRWVRWTRPSSNVEMGRNPSEPAPIAGLITMVPHGFSVPLCRGTHTASSRRRVPEGSRKKKSKRDQKKRNDVAPFFLVPFCLMVRGTLPVFSRQKQRVFREMPRVNGEDRDSSTVDGVSDEERMSFAFSRRAKRNGSRTGGVVLPQAERRCVGKSFRMKVDSVLIANEVQAIAKKEVRSEARSAS